MEKRKAITIRLDNEIMKQIRIIAVMQERPVNHVVEEALKLLIGKHSTDADQRR